MSAPPPSAAPRLLVVEDEAMVAIMLEDMLTMLGVRVLGPAGSVAQALRLIDAESADLDGAILDINLGTEPVYPVARRLQRAGLPFAFITGYGALGIDAAYAGQPVLEKPFELGDLEAMIDGHFRGRRRP